jgi:FkbM family methyltransferase
MSVLNNLEISQIDRVLILGGYTGESTDRFLSAADCTIVVLEPVQEYFHLLEKRFQDERRLRFFNYGVANADRSVNIYVNGQTTSAFEEFGTPQLVQLRDISNVLEEIGGVDILEINIEGGEYDVLERLIEVDLLREIRILLIQFHTTVEGHESRRANIRDHLRKSHTETFNYEYVWERWDLSI